MVNNLNAEIQPLNILSATRDIADAPNDDAVIHRTLVAARELLKIDGAFWMSVTTEKLVMRALSGIGRPEVMLESSLPISEGIGGRAVKTGQPVWVSDYSKYPGRHRDLTQVGLNEGFCSIAAIPVQRGTQTTAVLYVLSRSERTYSDAEIRILLALSAFGATIETQRAGQDDLARNVLRLEDRVDTAAQRHEVSLNMARRLALGESTTKVLADTSRELGVSIHVETHDPRRISATIAVPSSDEIKSDLEDDGALPKFEKPVAPITAPISGSRNQYLAAYATEPVDESHLLDLGVIIGLALARERSVIETETRLRGDFISELLVSTRMQENSLNQRQAALGIDLCCPHRVVALGQKRNVGKRTLDRLHQVVSEKVQGAIVSAYEGRVVMLWPAKEEKLIKQNLAYVLQAVRPDKFSAGIGGVCDSLGDYATSVREALFAEQIAQHRSSGERIVDIEETGLYRIFAQVTTVTDLRAAVIAAVGGLFEVDRKQGSDLVRTLRVYLENDRKLSHSSRELHLHPNTLRYRVEKISRILEIDFEDPDARFFTLMALRLAIEIPETSHIPSEFGL